MSWIAKETHTELQEKYMDVYPMGEEWFHQMGRGVRCGCGPKFQDFPNGSRMATHNAWDEREELESPVEWV